VRRSAQDDDSVGEPEVKLQVPPLRYASAGMTKWRAAAPPWQRWRGMDRATQQQPILFRLPVFSALTTLSF